VNKYCGREQSAVAAGLKKLIAQSGGVGAREREKQKEAKFKKTASSQLLHLSRSRPILFSLQNSFFCSLHAHTYTAAAVRAEL
jgi:hypothetical protein